jgi:hypothetical protein
MVFIDIGQVAAGAHPVGDGRGTPWQTIEYRVRSYKNQHIPENNWDLTAII